MLFTSQTIEPPNHFTGGDMYQDILSNTGYECQDCGKVGVVLVNGSCPDCHYVIEHNLWAARQVDVLDTGKLSLTHTDD
jgi:hypothetical protein